MNSLVVYPDEGWQSGRITLVGSRAREVSAAGSYQVGDTLRIALFGGDKGGGKIRAFSSEKIVIDLTWIDPSLDLRPIDLIVGLSRPQTTKKVIQAAVMSGIRSLHFVHLESGEKSYLDSHLFREDDLRYETAKALEQIWEGRYPDIRVHRDFGRFIRGNTELLSASDSRLSLIAQPGGGVITSEMCSANDSAVIAVGSEGGWSPRELATFNELGFVPVGLGARIVRVEIALLYLLGQTLGVGVNKPCASDF
jgi:16S rRNA (uracil1498-N3)-methyltransferase